MPDYLIQRYLHDRTNEVRQESGVWEDVLLVLGMDPAQAEAEVSVALGELMPLKMDEPDRIRAIDWSGVYEFVAPAGPRVLTMQAKAAPPGDAVQPKPSTP